MLNARRDHLKCAFASGRRAFLSALILVAFIQTPLTASAICSGNNWVSTCPSGTYDLQALFSNGIDLTPSGGGVIPLVQFAGTSDIFVGTPSGNSAPTTLNIDATQIGGTASVKAVDSVGGITRQTGDPTLADSFFDVFFEIDFGGGFVLHNNDALVVTTVLDGLPIPPGTTFSESPLSLALYSGNSTTPAGFLLAPPSGFPPKSITPEPGTLITMAAGILVAVVFRRRIALMAVESLVQPNRR